MEATTPELVLLASGVQNPVPPAVATPCSRRSCKKLSKSTAEYKTAGAPNFFVQHDKVEDSKLRRYLETCGRALEQFLQRQTSSNDSIVFLLGMAFD